MSDLNSKLPRGVDLPMLVGSDEAKIFSGPESLKDRDNWRRELQIWKAESALRIEYDDTRYSTGDFKPYNSFNMALVWLWDELLFDYSTQEFTPEKFLDDSRKFGGLDGVILWHAYPVIGIDSRNQFDFYDQVEGLSELIARIQSKGVKVYLNYNPWDRWTARPNNLDQYELARLVKEHNFDGVFLDTMKSADPLFMEPILEVKPDIIVAGESRIQQDRICDHVMSWAQWFGDSQIPGVIRAKWFEPRHMLHQTRRWNKSHIEELHIAWLNGSGMLLWEVVFGSLLTWSAKEKLMWKEMVEILRRYSYLIAQGDWEPLTKLDDLAESSSLYGSKFSVQDSYLITIINKSDENYVGQILDGVSGTVPGKGVAAVIRDRDGLRLAEFSYQDADPSFLEITPSRVKQLIGEKQELRVSFRNRECGLYDGPPFIDAWKPLPPNFHQKFTLTKEVLVRKGALDKSEVTNKEFLEFINASGYKPTVKNRFLAHWIDGRPQSDDLDKPVTYVDLEDAMAYAQWAKCLIPTEWEWQANAVDIEFSAYAVWNLTDSLHSDGRTRFLILKGGSTFNIRNGQGQKSTSGIAESDWYIDGDVQDPTWVEKLLMMGKGMSRSENIGFRCFTPVRIK